jgi:hypothetical protein
MVSDEGCWDGGAEQSNAGGREDEAGAAKRGVLELAALRIEARRHAACVRGSACWLAGWREAQRQHKGQRTATGAGPREPDARCELSAPASRSPHRSAAADDFPLGRSQRLTALRTLEQLSSRHGLNPYLDSLLAEPA